MPHGNVHAVNHYSIILVHLTYT